MDIQPTIPSTWRNYLLAGLFLIFLILPVLDWEFHLDPTALPAENRLLAPLPTPPKTFSDLKRFQAGWEAYFSDRFGFRNCLIQWGNKLKWFMFRSRNSSALLGQDGWVFFSGNGMIEQFRGARPFTESQLKDWQRLLEHRRDWLARRGIRYIFVLAPDKQSVYPEELPVWLKDLGGRTKADQFLDYMQAHSTVKVLNLRPLLLKAKKVAPDYQKIDTHWNNYGAFLACEDVIRTLAKDQVPGLTPLTLDSFNITNHLVPGGDMASQLGVTMLESNALILIPKPELPALDIFNPTGVHMRDPAYVKNPQGAGQAVILTDSFGHFWLQFMGYHFAEADFLWQYNLDAPLIERKRPVVVVNEMLERFFYGANPKELYTQDALP